MWTRARALAVHIPVSPIFHDVRQLNTEIRAGQYFFVDILREGNGNGLRAAGRSLDRLITEDTPAGRDVLLLRL